MSGRRKVTPLVIGPAGISDAAGPLHEFRSRVVLDLWVVPAADVSYASPLCRCKVVVMAESLPLFDPSRVLWAIDKSVVLLEVTGVEGWHLPTNIKLGDGEVELTWSLVAKKPLVLTHYRILFGDRWYDFWADRTTINRNDEYVITASMRLK